MAALAPWGWGHLSPAGEAGRKLGQEGQWLQCEPRPRMRGRGTSRGRAVALRTRRERGRVRVRRASAGGLGAGRHIKRFCNGKHPFRGILPRNRSTARVQRSRALLWAYEVAKGATVREWKHTPVRAHRSTNSPRARI